MNTAKKPRVFIPPTYGNQQAPVEQPQGATSQPQGASLNASYSPGGTYSDAFSSTNQGAPVPSPQQSPQQASVLGTLPESLAASYQQTLSEMVSGKAYDPYQSVASEGFLRASQQLKARNAAANYGRAGQGAAAASQMATEAQVMQMGGDMALQTAAERQGMKERGVGAVNTLAGMEDQSRLSREALASQEKITAAEIASREKMGFASLDLDKAKFEESTRQYDTSFEFQKDQWGDDLKLKYDQLTTNADLTRLGLVSEKEIAGMRISSDEKVAGMQIKSAETIASDRNYLDQQGIDIQKAATYGYTRADGTYVPGQLDIAAERLGMDKYTTSVQMDLAQRSFNMDTEKFIEAKRAASVAEGLEGIRLQDARNQFSKTYGLELDKFVEDTSRWDKEQVAEGKRWEKEFGLKEDQVADAMLQWKTTLSKQDEWNIKDFDIKEQSMEAERVYREGLLGIEERKMDITEASVETEQYWDEADKFSAYALSHPDVLDGSDADVAQIAAGWYEARFGAKPNLSDPEYIAWARGELEAATDNRLTNPFDASMYMVDQSDLPNDMKAVWKQVLADPKTYGIDFKVNADGRVEIVTGPEAPLTTPAVAPPSTRSSRSSGATRTTSGTSSTTSSSTPPPTNPGW